MSEQVTEVAVAEAPLTVATVASFSAKQVADILAHGLGETLMVPRAQIYRTVIHLGGETAVALYDQALALEAAGGEMLPDKSRRRTVGGIFFRLVRERAPREVRWRIFPRQPAQGRPQAPLGQHAPQVAAAPRTDAPAAPIAPIVKTPIQIGEARTVKLTLIGRPGNIITKPAGYVMTSMTSTKVPALPKGVPAPPAKPTVYTVYIATKQWTKVSEALLDPEDVLIAEGFPVFDPDLEGMAVYVSNVSTKKLQQAAKAQKATG